MDEDGLDRLILAELAKPRWEGKFGPSSWDMRATLQQAGASVSAPALGMRLARLREAGLIRYQSPRGSESPVTVGNLKITPQGREQLARWVAPAES